MATRAVSVSMGDLVKRITVTVRVTKPRFWDMRLWLGRKIVVLGAWIAGLGHKESEITKQSIYQVGCKCLLCGWRGKVVHCAPDVDGDGSLGCPRCFAIVKVQFGKGP